jgi:hypothetical protein
MKGKFLQVVGLVCSSLLTIAIAHAQFDDYSYRQDLVAIVDYADLSCNGVETSGGNSTCGARVGVDADLLGLASKLAQIPGYTPPRAWPHTSDPRPAIIACQQGDQDACRAVAARARAGCQMMGKQEDCALANTMATMGY